MSTTHDETRLHESLDRLAASLDLPGSVTDRAIARGRRLRARRRTTVALGSLAAAAVVAVGVPTLTSALGGSNGDVHFADSGEAVTGPAHLTARTLAHRLMPLLPAGSTASDVMYRNTDKAPDEKDAPLRGYLAMNLDTGRAAGGLNLVFYPKGSVEPARSADPDASWSLRCPTDATSCSVKRDGEGRVVSRELEAVDASGVTTNTVTLLRGDGTVTYLATSNSTHRKWAGPPTSAEPPLTLSQLLAVAADETWDR